MIVDLRSDTVTKPTPEMLDAMYSAEVGDDVFDEDPTVHELEHYASDLFGMESAIFCPSGTMTNQIAIKVLTQPLEEIICDRLSHIYNYEGGGIAFNSSASVRTINGDRGRIGHATGEVKGRVVTGPVDVLGTDMVTVLVISLCVQGVGLVR